MFGGFQVVPAPDGQFAFLIPNGAFGSQRPSHPSLHQQQRDLGGPQRGVTFQRPLSHGPDSMCGDRGGTEGSGHPSP